MRHKVPYYRDTSSQGEDLADGVVARQTMKDCSDIYDKEPIERSVSEAGREADLLIVEQPMTIY